MRRGAVALIATSMLGGCVTMQPLAPLVDLRGPCHDSLHEVAPRSIPLFDREQRSRLPATAQFATLAECVIDAESGRPTAAARFEIDPAMLPAILTVEVIGSELGTLPAAASVLDGALVPIAVQPFASFVQRGSNYSTQLHVTDPAARFLVVAPDPLHLGRSREVVSARNQPVVIFTTAFVASVDNGREQRTQLPLDAAGALRVYAEPYRRQSTRNR